MATINEIRLLRSYIRNRLSEDVYDPGGRYSRPRVPASVNRYLGGELPSRGVPPHISTEVVLDDLRAAFGAEGWDSDSELLRAVDDLDKDAAVERIRDILNTGFIAPDSPLGKQGYKKISDALLPGDEEDLINLILGDMFDGDSMITLY